MSLKIVVALALVFNIVLFVGGLVWMIRQLKRVVAERDAKGLGASERATRDVMVPVREGDGGAGGAAPVATDAKPDGPA